MGGAKDYKDSVEDIYYICQEAVDKYKSVNLWQLRFMKL
jgi:hypothetical protein